MVKEKKKGKKEEGRCHICGGKLRKVEVISWKAVRRSPDGHLTVDPSVLKKLEILMGNSH